MGAVNRISLALREERFVVLHDLRLVIYLRCYVQRDEVLRVLKVALGYAATLREFSRYFV